MAECKRAGAWSAEGSISSRTLSTLLCCSSIQCRKRLLIAVATGKFPQRFRLENFHLLLGILQLALTKLQQFRATFVCREGFFQRKLASLHIFDDGLQLRECIFEGQFLFGFRFRHDRFRAQWPREGISIIANRLK